MKRGLIEDIPIGRFTRTSKTTVGKNTPSLGRWLTIGHDMGLIRWEGLRCQMIGGMNAKRSISLISLLCIFRPDMLPLCKFSSSVPALIT